MKKIFKTSIAVFSIGFTSFSSVAGHPGPGDCNAWKEALDRCYVDMSVTFYGKSCNEVNDILNECYHEQYDTRHAGVVADRQKR